MITKRITEKRIPGRITNLHKKASLYAVTATVMGLLLGCADGSAKEKGDLMEGIQRQEGTLSTHLVENAENADDLKVLSKKDGVVTITDFGIRLLQQSYKQDGGNQMISPLSVATALTMTANGAREETRKQMEEVLGRSVEELNVYLASCMQTLPHGDKYKFRMANAIWFRDSEQFTVEQDFLQTNADFFEAGLYKAPFDSSTLKEINSWVNDNTDGMIDQILNQISPDAVMYLVNALAFDAEWQTNYTKDQLRDSEFTKEDGTTQKIELMYSTEDKYLETDTATGFLKYYADEAYAFVALLPKEEVTLWECLSSLSGETLNRLLMTATSEQVRAAIPKFESAYSVEMNNLLQEMGIADAFDPDRANLSGIGTYTGGSTDVLYIDQVLHKTYISVNARGTRAAAATTVAVNGGAAPTEVPTVYLKRPFLYMIIDCESNLPMFMGTVTEIK